MTIYDQLIHQNIKLIAINRKYKINVIYTYRKECKDVLKEKPQF